MSKRKIALRAVTASTALALLCAGQIARPMTVGFDPLEAFSDCAGRLAAEVIFSEAWKRDIPERTRQDQILFEELVTTVVTAEAESDAQMRQVQAQVTHMALLWRATFSFEPREAALADRHAARQVAMCQSMLSR